MPINDDLNHIYDVVLNRDVYTDAGRIATLAILGTGECDLYGLRLSYADKHATMYSVNQKLGNEFYSGDGMCGGTIIDNINLQQYESNRYSTTQEFNNFTFVATEWGNL